MSDGLTEDSECPECGNRALTEYGVTVTYSDGSVADTLRLSCINCSFKQERDNE